jgi:hypothetical protein
VEFHGWVGPVARPPIRLFEKEADDGPEDIESENERADIYRNDNENDHKPS